MVSLRSLAVAALAAAAMLTLGLLGARPASAFPSSSNSAPATARIEAEIKPHFGHLIDPPLHHWRPYRPSWAPSWQGRFYGDYDQGYGQGYGGYPGDGYANGGYPGDYNGGGYQQGGYPGGGYGAGGCPDGGGYILDGAYVCGQGYPGGGYPQGGYSQGGYPGGYGGSGYGDPSFAWNPQGDFSTYGPPSIFPSGGGGLNSLTVDCRDTGRGPQINTALAQLSPGGTLYLRGRGPACEESLQIQQPVIIAGEPAPAFATGPDAGVATIKAPPGAPCAVIGVGPRGGVEFRDIAIEAPHAGSNGCIQSWGSAVALVRTTVHYAGDGSALYAHGGQLFVNDSEIDSASEEAAVWAEDAALVFRNVGINASTSGIDVKTGESAGVQLDHVSLWSAGDGRDSRRQVGLIARRSRTLSGRFDLKNVHISGFGNGMLFEEGVNATVVHSHVGHSRIGVVVDGAKLDLRDSAIGAEGYGLYAYAGEVTVSHTRIYSRFHRPLAADPGAVVHDEDISYYDDDCGGLFGFLFGGHHWSCHSRRDFPAFTHEDDYGGPHHWGEDSF